MSAVGEANINWPSTLDNVIIFPVYIDTHITALEFFESLLIAGEGASLCVYDTKKCSLIFQQQLFHGCNIHGIRINEKPQGETYSMCVFAGKVLRVLQCINSSSFQLIDVTEVICFNDWIWDVRWFQMDTNFGYETLAVVSGHNTMKIWNWKTNSFLQTLRCENKCLLYPWECNRRMYVYFSRNCVSVFLLTERYSAAVVGSSLNELTVIAGTVFRELVIWCAKGPEDIDGNKKILHHLEGHEGVIFSVTYNPSLRLICSTSDDRSVRLWNVTVPVDSKREIPAHLWEVAEIQLQCILYGHMARVWKAICLHHCLVSIGEDSVLCIWDYNGTVMQKLRGHNGGHIWSVAVNATESWLATGGSDAGIRLWPITDEALNSKATSIAIPLPITNSSTDSIKRGKPDFPRVIGLLDAQHLLIMTNEGILYCHNSVSGHWNILLKDPTYHSYSLMVPAPWGRYVALGSLSGQLLIIDTDECNGQKQAFQCVREQVYSDKILTIIWLDNEHLLSCGSQGNMLLWHVYDSGGCLQLVLQSHFLLPPCRQRWVSAAILLPRISLLVCGDRCGSVHAFNCEQTNNHSQVAHSPVQTFHRIHSKTGVTDVRYHCGHLYTAGRDGIIHMYVINNRVLEELRSVKAAGGLDWIAKLLFLKGNLIVLGFHTKNFVIWSWEQQRSIISIPCGGGHRSWDFKFSVDSVRLVYIRSGIIYQSELNTVFHSSPILKPSNHARAVCCVRYLFSVKKNSELIHLCATASEDITINIIAFSRNSLSSGVYPVSRQSLHVLQGHISSVRTLATCTIQCKAAQSPPATTKSTSKKNRKSFKKKIVPPDLLMFSAGGRAQLKVWHLKPNCSSSSSAKDDKGEICSSRLLASHLLKEPKHNHRMLLDASSDVETETRYMDFTAFGVCEINESLPSHLYLSVGACSDGFLRVFGFNLKTRKLQILASLSHHQHCVLRVTHFLIHHEGLVELVVVSAATDGKLAFWNLTDLAIAFADVELRVLKEIRQDSTEGQYEQMEDESSSYESDASSIHIANTKLSQAQVQKMRESNLKNKILQVDNRNVGILERPCFNHLYNSYGNPTDENSLLISDASNCINNEKVDWRTQKRDEMGGFVDKMLVSETPFLVLPVHQSGINSLVVQEITGDTVLIATGGDDNSLHTTVIKVNPCPPLPNIKADVLATVSVASAHAAQITELKSLSNNILIATSIDQRLSVWHWTFNGTDLTVKMIGSKFSNIADISSLDVWSDSKTSDRGCYLVCVAGEGLQVFQCCLPQPQVERLI